MRRRLAACIVIAAATLGGVGCSAPEPDADARLTRARVIYGMDDRAEVYRYDGWIHDAAMRVIALGKKDEVVIADDGTVAFTSPSWQDRASLCAGQRFGEQPAFARCSAIAVTSDLVLTASHCVRGIALGDLVGVTGFNYNAEGELRPIAPGDVRPLLEVVAEDDYFDVAWLRLDGSAIAEASPFAIPGLPSSGSPVTSINHGGGIPAKVDSGGSAYPLDLDSFVTDIDAFGGASGAPVFSSDGSLLGILTAGSDDYVKTDECFVAATQPSGASTANELVVALSTAAEKLCASAPDPQVCQPTTVVPTRVAGGCSVQRAPQTASARWLVLLALGFVQTVRGRRRRRAKRGTRSNARNVCSVGKIRQLG